MRASGQITSNFFSQRKQRGNVHTANKNSAAMCALQNGNHDRHGCYGYHCRLGLHGHNYHGCHGRHGHHGHHAMVIRTHRTAKSERTDRYDI